MGLFWQSLITGITTGSIYALVGLGLGIIYNVSRVINLAQGEFLTIGAFFLFSMLAFKVPLLIAIPLAMIATAVLGLIFEHLVIHPAWNSPPRVLLIATVAVSIIIKGVTMLIWGKDAMSIPSFSGEQPVKIGQTIIVTQVFWVLGALILVAVFSWYFFNKSIAGKSILAVSQNRDAAALVGVNIRFVVRLAFALSVAVAALGGGVVSPITFVAYDGGSMMGLKGFIALTLGGMDSIWGGIVGGLILGLFEAFGAAFISAQYKDLLAFLLLIVVLYWSPNGILGYSHKRRA